MIRALDLVRDCPDDGTVNVTGFRGVGCLATRTSPRWPRAAATAERAPDPGEVDPYRAEARYGHAQERASQRRVERPLGGPPQSPLRQGQRAPRRALHRRGRWPAAAVRTRFLLTRIWRANSVAMSLHRAGSVQGSLSAAGFAPIIRSWRSISSSSSPLKFARTNALGREPTASDAVWASCRRAWARTRAPPPRRDRARTSARSRRTGRTPR